MRAYGTEPQVWGGNDPDCEHVWGAEQPKPGNEYREGLSTSKYAGRDDKTDIREAISTATGGSYCQGCGAWRGELGSEPTIGLYIDHLVEIFREVKRVMRSDGCLFINMGDSFSSSTSSPAKAILRDDLTERDYCEVALAIRKHMPELWASCWKAKGKGVMPEVLPEEIQSGPLGAGKGTPERILPQESKEVHGEDKEEMGTSEGTGDRENGREVCVLRGEQPHLSLSRSHQGQREERLSEGRGAAGGLETGYRRRVAEGEIPTSVLELQRGIRFIRFLSALKLNFSDIPQPLKVFFHADTHDLKPKDLCMIPARLALALQADGWYLRSDCIWGKVNPMPEPVAGWRWERHRIKVQNQKRDANTKIGGNARECRPSPPHPDNGIKMENAKYVDCPGCEKCTPNGGLVLRRGSWRPTKAHEYIFQLTKSERYYGDGEGVKEAGTIAAGTRGAKGSENRSSTKGINSRPPEYKVYDGTRNLRSVFSLPSEPSRLAHYATFPRRIPEIAIKSSTSERGVCPMCGAPWARVVTKGKAEDHPARLNRTAAAKQFDAGANAYGEGGGLGKTYATATLGWRPTCGCDAGEAVPATVLDPFSGTGTTGVVAVMLGRDYVGIELKPQYAAMSRERIRGSCGLLAEIVVRPEETIQ